MNHCLKEIIASHFRFFKNRTEQNYFSFKIFFLCIAKHINMADNSVGTPQLNLHKISTGQFLETLLCYNLALLETEISFLAIR